jgi:hypothetical protein
MANDVAFNLPNSLEWPIAYTTESQVVKFCLNVDVTSKTSYGVENNAKL